MPSAPGEPALIDRHMPCYDVRARYAVPVAASPERAYGAVRALDLSESPVVRTLFRLRGLPTGRLDFSRLERVGFVTLGEAPGREYLLGLVGRFWTAGGDLQRIPDAAAFDGFTDPRFAKSTWNFTVRPGRAAGLTEVATETRVRCLGPAAGRRFRIYWSLIGPFSGWIRREALRLVRRAAEAQ